MRTGDLTELVMHKYGAEEGQNATQYIAITQVRAATGWADPSTADIMIMGNWPSTGAELMGFEVKVSRSDWLRELKFPDKCEPTKKYCDRWWLVIANESFVKEGELPEEWGMMAVKNDKLKIIKDAPKLTPEPLNNLFVASLLRANNKETIPVDLHKDKIADAKREAIAAEQAKIQQLKDYLKFLHKELGIKIEYAKGWRNEWEALIGGRHHNAQDVAMAIRRLINGDDKEAAQTLDRLKEKAQEIVKFIDGERDNIY